jgi:hypothetical protein
MKPIEVAEAKSEDLYQKLFDDLKREVFQIRGKANIAGALHSSAVGVQIRVASREKMKQLQGEMIKLHIEALGHGLDHKSTKDSIAKKVGIFFEQCKSALFKPEYHMPANAQNLTVFETEAEQLLNHLDRDLQIATHEAKKAAPGFWKDKRHDIWLAIIAGLVGIAGTLLTQWLLRLLKWQGP